MTVAPGGMGLFWVGPTRLRPVATEIASTRLRLVLPFTVVYWNEDGQDEIDLRLAAIKKLTRSGLDMRSFLDGTPGVVVFK
jgi:hypothetical protein